MQDLIPVVISPHELLEQNNNLRQLIRYQAEEIKHLRLANGNLTVNVNALSETIKQLQSQNNQSNQSEQDETTG